MRPRQGAQQSSRGKVGLRLAAPRGERERTGVTEPGDEAPAKTTEAPRAGLSGGLGRLVQRLRTLRGQLIIPYVLLTLVTAMLGTYVVTRLVTSSVRERFVNQMYEASRVAADGVVRRERAQLRILRLVTFTSGMPEALLRGEVNPLLALMQPVAINEGAELVIAVDRRGREIAGLTLPPDETTYRLSTGSDFSGVPSVMQVLTGKADARGDKYVGLIQTSFGHYFFTAAPVYSTDGALTGAILVGTRLEQLAKDLKSESLADIILQDQNGDLLATTIAEPDEGFSVILLDAARAASLTATVLEPLELSGREYQAAYGPWYVREQPMGTMGVVLPSNFLVTQESTWRTVFSGVFALGTAAIMLLGFWLAQNIARPILRLRTMAQAVASGDLKQESGLERPDEIGDLAKAFDTMTERLQMRTAEAERLYAEAIERNRQLAEMYERLQAAQRQLVQSEKLAAVGQLAAGIVHDVKNPLGVIKGLSEELLEDPLEGAGAIEAYRQIRDNAARANSIVTDLLVFARQSTTAMSRRDLRETIEGSLRLTDYLLRKGKVAVEKKLPTSSVYATYDPQQIQQVLINLIQNAVQAMPDGGTLRVAMTVEDSKAVVSVQDTGTGIDPEVMPRIFEPFFTTKPEGQGTGMGLAVSYGILTRHGGSIEVASQVGQGSTFTLRIPTDSLDVTSLKESAA
jgi:two-component system NtrC family sensor kinase